MNIIINTFKGILITVLTLINLYIQYQFYYYFDYYSLQYPILFKILRFVAQLITLSSDPIDNVLWYLGLVFIFTTIVLGSVFFAILLIFYFIGELFKKVFGKKEKPIKTDYSFMLYDYKDINDYEDINDYDDINDNEEDILSEEEILSIGKALDKLNSDNK